MHRYNTIDGLWYAEPPMNATRHSHSAAALSDSELIVCGGFSGRRDCDVYSATTRQWSRTGDLIHGRYRFTMVVFGGEVYALGGDEDVLSDELTDTVETYDRQTRTWAVVAKKLAKGRSDFVGLTV